MAGMSAEHINPFLIASTNVLKDMCAMEVKMGKPYLKDTSFGKDSYVIIIGITGEMRGQVMIALKETTACHIASKMCMMPITKMDELSMSAICELGNMIMGNAATVFSSKGINIDITPPTLSHGEVTFQNNFTKNLCVPLVDAEDNIIELNLSVLDN